MKRKKIIILTFIIVLTFATHVFTAEISGILIPIDKICEDLKFVVTQTENEVILEDENFTINIKIDDLAYTVNGVQHINNYKPKIIDDVLYIPIKNIAYEIGAIIEIDPITNDLIVMYNDKTSKLKLEGKVNINVNVHREENQNIQTLDDLNNVNFINFEQIVKCMDMTISEYTNIVESEYINIEALNFLKNNTLKLESLIDKELYEFYEFKVCMTYFTKNIISATENTIKAVEAKNKGENKISNEYFENAKIDFEAVKKNASEFIKVSYRFYDMNEIYEVINNDNWAVTEQVEDKIILTLHLIDMMCDTLSEGAFLINYSPYYAEEVFDILKEEVAILRDANFENVSEDIEKNIKNFINEFEFACNYIIEATNYYKVGDVEKYKEYYNISYQHFEKSLQYILNIM